MLLSYRRLMILEGAVAWQLFFIQRAVNDLRYCSEIYHDFPGAMCIATYGDITTFFVSGNPIILSLLASTLATALVLVFSWAGYNSLKLFQRLLVSRGKKDELRFLRREQRDDVPAR
jgi:hypothetical protein